MEDLPLSWLAGPAFSRLDRLLPIGPCAKGGPTLRLQTYTFNRKCLCSARAHNIFRRGVRCHRKQKWTASFLNAFNYHNSFFNRNNGHCFSAMRSLSFFNSGREDKVLKLFFSVSIKSVSYLAGQLVFNSCYYKIRFNSYCCFNSYCYLSSQD